jgi:hypothetical protein
LQVWTMRQMLASHYKTVDATGMVHTLAQLTAQPKQGFAAGMLSKLAGR